MLAVFVENEPIGMLLHYFRHDVFMRLPSTLAILDPELKPPQLNQLSLLMEVCDHFVDGISGESFRPRVPVSIGIEPAIVERSPLDAKFLQLWNRADHLRRRDVEFVTPPAPTHVVGL